MSKPEIDFNVTLDMALEVGSCGPGIFEWMRDRPNFSYKDFARNGVSALKILAENDGDGNQIVRRLMGKGYGRR